MRKEWSLVSESNQRPDDYKSTALPAELTRRIKIIYLRYNQATNKKWRDGPHLHSCHV